MSYNLFDKTCQLLNYTESEPTLVRSYNPQCMGRKYREFT